MADNYADRLEPEQALDLIRLTYDMRATCSDYAVAQPTKKLGNWRHRVLLDTGHIRRPTRPFLVSIAETLELPAGVVDRWIAAHPDAIAGSVQP